MTTNSIRHSLSCHSLSCHSQIHHGKNHVGDDLLNKLGWCTILLALGLGSNAAAQSASRVPRAVMQNISVERSFASADSAKATGFVFSNANAITIPAAGSVGNASLFPSVINVSGIAVNAITKATIQINGFSHTFPDDVDIVLEAPDGTRSIVMSDAGGNTANGIAPPGINLSFSSTGVNQVPDSSALSAAAALRPGNYVVGSTAADETDTFSGAGNPGALRFSPADFDAFVGINPNGNWKLFVNDDASGDVGAIANGWTLVLTVPTIFTVTKTADTNDGTCDVDCSLREAIAAAAALSGNNELIRFASPLFDSAQTITLTLGQLVATESVVIQGPGAAKLTISGNDQSRILLTDTAAAVSLSGMTFTRGRAIGGVGGAILSQGYLSMRNMAITGNQTVAGPAPEILYGGGLYSLNGKVNIVNCTFSDNRAGDYSGAIEFVAVSGSPANWLRMVNSTISGNTAKDGIGAIEVFNDISGGNIQVEMINNTIVNNHAPSTGSIELFTQGGVANTISMNLRNNIIANNAPSNIESVNNGGPITITSQGFNLTNDAVASYYSSALGDQLGADPRLGPLNNNGGQVETHALLNGSTALDQGQASGYARDVRGVDRALFSVGTITPNSDLSDIGAAEMRSIIVTNVADSGLGSLRDAINQANINPDQNDILFDSALFGVVPQTINLASALPFIDSSLSINGPSAKLLTLRRDTGGDYRILHSPNGTRELALSGITLSNGRGDGGGIRSLCRTSIAEVSIQNNADIGGIGGGGIQLVFADGTIKNSSITNNTTSASGGGIHFQPFNQRLRFINTTLSGNQAGIDSGAIIAANQDGSTAVLEISNSTIVNNTAPVNGGILAFTQGNPASVMNVLLRNTIIANNTLPNLNALSAAGTPQITSQGFNLSNDNGTVFLNQATDKINTNPQLSPLADNGGPTRTHAPLSNSPAIDAAGFNGNRDQIGYARGVDVAGVVNAIGGDGSDIGAVELPLLFRDGFE
jgi:CSLREA domain-containing protein